MEVMVNGIRMQYDDSGEGPAVLLVHAFPLNGKIWQSQVAALRERYRVITPDLRGFGGSDAPDGVYTMEQHADDLAALLDQLDLEQVILGGLSMGGYVSFAFLRRYGMRVRALVLCNTKAGPDTIDGQATREANARLVEEQGSAAIATKLIQGLVTPGASTALRLQLAEMIGSTSPRGIAGALRGMAMRPDSHADLPHIQVPTLIIVGSEDTITPRDDAQDLHTGIAGSKLVTIGDAGHLSNLEQPAAFNSVLREFLDRLG